ncbi:hypothetical protein [Pseudotabrizicola algicola]|uniref:Flagellar protein FlgN n=1 Tax=Pseudotabrizicola algicola TaxID=2709381 RepID=A0A6B3RK24_9RHOB|nr:hypothetical protein [Pseudotabrizicola algicola]NEX46370.1 hypothetical protein [Pseudotabrizicola algicola]
MTANAQETLRLVRQAVIAGNYRDLVDLLPELISREYMLSGADAESLARLRDEATRTANCLEAALAGVRAARRRTSEIIEANKGLTTYDRAGAKATVPFGAPNSRRV